MASLRPACSSDSCHRAHPLANRRTPRASATGSPPSFSAWTDGEVKFTGPVRVSFLAGCLDQGPDRARRQQAVARGAIACRQRSESVPRSRRSFCAAASPWMPLVLRLAEAAHHLARQRDGNRGAGRGATDPVHHAPLAARRCACCMCAGAGSCFRTTRRAIKEIYAHIDAGKETGAVSGFGSFIYKDMTSSLLAGQRIANLDGRRGELSRCSHPPLKALPREAERHSVIHRRLSSSTATCRPRSTTYANFSDGPASACRGRQPKGFSASGGFHLAGSGLTFDDGTFTLDGNRAVGLLRSPPGIAAAG